MTNTLDIYGRHAAQTRSWLLQGAAVGAVLSLSVGAPALAQTATGAQPAPSDAGTTVGEVVVTARHRVERLKDVPIAATVIGGQALAQRGTINDTGAVLDGVPGVRFNNTDSPTTSEISIRGSGTARGTTADSGVGLYRNGVFVSGGLQFTRNFTWMDLFDPDRIEILRGTLGALYGRDAVGGAINVVSAQPVFRQTGFADVNWGTTLSAFQFQGVENIPINDEIAVRLGVNYLDQAKGFFYDQNFDNYFDAQHALGSRVQIRFKKDNFDADLLVERQQMVTAPVTDQLVIAPTASKTTFPNGFTQPRYDYSWSIPAEGQINATNVIFNASYDFGWATLTSVSAYHDVSGNTTNDADGFSPALLALARSEGNPATSTDPNQNKQTYADTPSLYEEDYLTGRKVFGISWLAGFDVLHQPSYLYQILTKTPAAGAFNPPCQFAPNCAGTYSQAHQLWNSPAVFGSLGYDITPKLSVTAEGRYTRDDKTINQNTYTIGTVTKTQPTINEALNEGNFSYNIDLSYHFTPDLMAYAKVGTGYRTGGFNAVNGTVGQPVPIPPNYQDENSITYEVGTKQTWGRHFYGTLTGYYTKVNNVLVQDNNGCGPGIPACPVAATAFVTNGGQGYNWGIEAEGDFNFDLLGGATTLQLNGSHQEGQFTQGPYDRLSIPQLAKWISGANLNYTHPFIDDTSLFFNANYSGQWGGKQDVSVPYYPMATYRLLDLRGGVNVKHWQFAVWGKNVTNDQYVQFYATTSLRWSAAESFGVDAKYAW